MSTNKSRQSSTCNSSLPAMPLDDVVAPDHSFKRHPYSCVTRSAVACVFLIMLSVELGDPGVEVLQAELQFGKLDGDSSMRC
jgi:hypothetical protein